MLKLNIFVFSFLILGMQVGQSYASSPRQRDNRPSAGSPIRVLKNIGNNNQKPSGSVGKKVGSVSSVSKNSFASLARR